MSERQEIRKRASEPDPTDIRKSVHAKHARKGVNEWAGAYSKTLGKDGMMVFRGVLLDVVEDLKVVASALRGHFGDTGGSLTGEP